MLTQDSGKKKTYKILLDIVVTLAIISFINLILGLFGIKIPVISYVGVPIIIALVFFILMTKFAWKLKKRLWILLFVLILIGIILQIFSGILFFQGLSTTDLLEGSAPPPTTNQQILGYGGQILSLIGFLSLIIFYFIHPRKYLKGEKTLQDIGGEQFADEQQFVQHSQEKEKKQNKVGWIIVIILVLIFAGVLIYMSLM